MLRSSSSPSGKSVRAAAWVATLLALRAALAVAAPGDPGQDEIHRKSEASAHLRRGAELIDAEDLEGALAQFEAAYRLVPSPNIFHNFGIVYGGMGRKAAALEAFQRFLGEADRPPPSTREYAQRAVQTLLAEVADLRVEAEVSGATIFVDGRNVGETPRTNPIYLDPGPHLLSVEKLGLGTIHAERIEVRAGQHLTVSARPAHPPPPTGVARSVPAAEAVKQTASPPEGVARRWQRPVAWGAAVGAVLAAGVFATELVLQHQHGTDFNKKGCGTADPDQGGGDCADLLSAKVGHRQWGDRGCLRRRGGCSLRVDSTAVGRSPRFPARVTVPAGPRLASGVLMPLRSNLVILAPALLSLLGCVSLQEKGSRSIGDAAAPDATGARPDTAPDAVRDAAPLGDATPDVSAPVCTPRAVSCTTDNRSTRTCTEQGDWVVTAPCPAETTCSGGVCLCAPGFCDEGMIIETQTAGFVEDLAAGGHFLFLAVNGSPASIRRFDIEARPVTEAVVRTGPRDFTRYALESDPTGNLISCSDTRAGATRSGQLMYGDQPLDAAACSHARRLDNLVYYLGDVLYRRALDASSPAETVTREAMGTFEIAGDSLYFAGKPNDEAFLKRLSLADPTVVETLLLRPGETFAQVMPDASDVYLITGGQILRVPRVAGSPPQVFWHEAGPSAWAMAQTDSHVYWTATTTEASGSMGCSEAQVFRQAKMGGPATVLAKAIGSCAGQLVVVADHLYAVIWGGVPSTAPTRILRIRQ